METLNKEVSTIEQIKKSYPDEWILLGNPDMDEYGYEIFSGIVICHSPDKREMVYLSKPFIKNYAKTMLFFNRVSPRKNQRVIASIFGPASI
jgi:hypothetical protein